jgi:hypothetical protein
MMMGQLSFTSGNPTFKTCRAFTGLHRPMSDRSQVLQGGCKAEQAIFCPSPKPPLRLVITSGLDRITGEEGDHEEDVDP